MCSRGVLTLPASLREKLVDANVPFASAASPNEQGAGLVVLRLAEITLIQALTSEQVIGEAERNLAEKLQQTLPTLSPSGSFV